MEEIKRILVGSRMSRYCPRALQYGISLTQKYGAQLFVVHVLYDPMTEGWSVPMISLEEERKRDMEKARRTLDDMVNAEKEKGMTIREFVREGDPAAQILKIIQEERIDLVILHAHEEGPYEHVFGIGNREIVLRLPCTAMLVRDPAG
jgi:nucleotide-binding universal stress UspA family protein